PPSRRLAPLVRLRSRPRRGGPGPRAGGVARTAPATAALPLLCGAAHHPLSALLRLALVDLWQPRPPHLRREGAGRLLGARPLLRGARGAHLGRLGVATRAALRAGRTGRWARRDALAHLRGDRAAALRRLPGLRGRRFHGIPILRAALSDRVRRV